MRPSVHELDASDTRKRVLRGKPRAYVQLRWSRVVKCIFGGRPVPLKISVVVWIACNGSLFLVSPQHLRHATRDKALADYVQNNSLRSFHGSLSHVDSESVRYYDLTGEFERSVATRVPVADFATMTPETPAPSGRPRRAPQSSGNLIWSLCRAWLHKTLSRCQHTMHESRNESGQRENEPTAAALPTYGSSNIGLRMIGGSFKHGLEKDTIYSCYKSLVLRNKSINQGSKKKEIDARRLDESEWDVTSDVFRSADSDNWKAHAANGAVRVLTPQEARKIPPSEILRIPSRFVRVNEDKTGQSLA
eukprot:3480490-Amphidinium_carterae.7